MVEVEGEGARFLLLHDFAGGSPNVGFDATAADRAEDRAIFADEHFRGLERGNRAAHIDDGGYGATLPGVPQLDNLFVNVHLG